MSYSYLPGACAVLTALLANGVHAAPDSLRVMTINLEDVSSEQLEDTSDARLCHLAEIIQRVQPDVLFVNEIAYDMGPPAGLNGSRLAGFLMKRQAPGTAGLRFVAYMAPSNTGIHSGRDLDNNGIVDTTPGTREYGGDCFGYGTYPGQYGMALLVRPDITIDSEHIRTFQKFLWKDMPDALIPQHPAGAGQGWYTDEELKVLRLSSKSHWDVPLHLPNGQTVHMLCSHPTPPVFDGPEDRNGRRNHDEIRFWGEYISGADWITDDKGGEGGLDPDAEFIIVGDLNADPEAGDSLDNPVGRFLLDHERVQDPGQISAIETEGLSPQATSRFKLRVDYVLPSSGLKVLASGVWRGEQDTPGHDGPALNMPQFIDFPTDHFPVWIDLSLEVEEGNSGATDTE